MANLIGHRVRLRRIRDNAVLFDSLGPVESHTDIVLDNDGFIGVDTYYLEALYVPDTTGSAAPIPALRRQVLVATGLQK